MATVAAFTVPAGEFPLGSVFEGVPGVTVELERVVPTGGDVVPYFWVRGADGDDVERRFREHPGASDIRLIDAVGDEQLLRCSWTPEHVGVLRAIEETGVTLLSGTGTSDRWTFEVRADDRETLSRFQAFALEHDLPLTLTTIQELPATAGEANDVLTGPQREALVLAFERGYFDPTRRVTLEQLAAELGITRQSLAGRLRRAHRNLIEHVLVAG
ncbi:bacterio-opsin activator domain-containing protein [Halorarum halobium]|uniref:helix-turn-helix domain-containing protein n=1 Tax=Halorarum halobium TaxID=3075121 RepID=UPI0028AA3839|nr:helix-turn-helix domain-containing protein [Halobaculum sp. XH14]